MLLSSSSISEVNAATWTFKKSTSDAFRQPLQSTPVSERVSVEWTVRPSSHLHRGLDSHDYDGRACARLQPTEANEKPDKLGELLHPTATPGHTFSAHRDPRRSLENNVADFTWLSEVVTNK